MPQQTPPVTLSRVNLNLLRVLAMISQERSITGAGDKLGLSQSAVSHALAQLRHMFDDELFTRTSSGMMPTPLAADIGERLPQAILDLEAAIAPRGFNPATSVREFTISCGDYTTYTFLPRIVSAFELAAPQATLTVRPLGQRLLEQLDSGKLDLVIAGVRGVPERIASEPLFRERTVWVVRRGHPLSGLAPEDWAAAERKIATVDYGFGQLPMVHDVFVGGQPAPIRSETLRDKDQLDELHCRTSTIVVPNFFAAIPLVTQLGFMTQLPERLACLLAPRYDLMISADWPADLGGNVSQAWHRAYGNSPALRWFRSIVTDVAADF